MKLASDVGDAIARAVLVKAGHDGKSCSEPVDGGDRTRERYKSREFLAENQKMS